MRILNEPNWKTKICFDNSVYKDVKSFVVSLPEKERLVYDPIVKFYRTHYSFEQVLNKLERLTTAQAGIFKNVVIRSINNIVYTPYQLKQYYLDIIKTKYSAHKEFLTQVLLYSVEVANHKQLPLKKLYKTMFGSYLKPIKAKLKKYAHRSIIVCPKISTKFTEYDYIRVAKETLFNLQANLCEQGIFGNFKSFDDLQISYNNDYGYGEWRSNKLHTRKDDLFIINSNENTITKQRLTHMVYLNVYPGVGYFCNCMYNPTNSNFWDVGATNITNGWATFAAWHYENGAYSKNSKILNGKIMHLLLTNSYDKAIEKIYMYLLSAKSKAETIEYLKMITEYPGMFESYIMGALATEQLIDGTFSSSPMQLLQKYKTVNVGEFYSLYK